MKDSRQCLMVSLLFLIAGNTTENWGSVMFWCFSIMSAVLSIIFGFLEHKTEMMKKKE